MTGRESCVSEAPILGGASSVRPSDLRNDSADFLVSAGVMPPRKARPVPTPSDGRGARDPESSKCPSPPDLRPDFFTSRFARRGVPPIGLDSEGGSCHRANLQSGGFYNRQGRNNRPDLPLKFRVTSPEPIATVAPDERVARAS